MTEIAKLFASFTPGPACPGCHQALVIPERLTERITTFLV